MAEENRIIRPFTTPQSLQDFLDEQLIFIVQPILDGEPDGDSIAIEPGETRRLDPKTFLTSDMSIAFRPNVDSKEFVKIWKQFAKDLGDASGDAITAVLYGGSSYLKFTDELGRWSINEIGGLEGSFAIAKHGSPRPRAARTAHHGSSFDLVLVLSDEIKKQSGLPWRKGSWIARVGFSLGNPMEGFGFTPLLLTKEMRKVLNVGPEAFKFARKNPFNGQLFESETLDDFIEFYVDDETLARLSAAPRNPQSALIQTEIFLSAIEFVVLEATRDPELKEKTIADLDGTLLDKMLRAISVEKKSEMEEWLQILKTAPELFLTKFEELVEYKSRLIKSLGDMR